MIRIVHCESDAIAPAMMEQHVRRSVKKFRPAFSGRPTILSESRLDFPCQIPTRVSPDGTVR